MTYRCQNCLTYISEVFKSCGRRNDDENKVPSLLIFKEGVSLPIGAYFWKRNTSKKYKILRNCLREQLKSN